MADFLQDLNIRAYCRRYGVSMWGCPPFLFVVMGAVIITVVLLTYTIGQRYTEPELLALIVLLLTAFLVVVAYVIMHAFENVVAARVKEAEQAHQLVRLKDQFVFVAAHELRTPATAIKWGIDVLRTQQNATPEKNKMLFNIIEQSNNRLLKLVHDMLEVARLESKTVKLELGPSSLQDAFTRAATGLRDRAHEREVTLRNEIPRDIPVVEADPVRLKEVLEIFLRNAVLYNNKGGTVWVRAKEQTDAVVVQVVDTGIGISEKDHHKVFQKFWRGDEAQAEGEGSGLGLFIAKQMVELMGGSVWFNSSAGGGSTFSFSLKRAE